MRSRNNSVDSSIFKYSVILFYIVFLIIPICRMLYFIKGVNISEIIASHSFVIALKNSIVSSFLATIITVLLSLVVSFCIRRTDIKFKNIFLTLFTLPMLLPSASHAFGLILLFGSNGLITRLLHLSSNIYGFNGIVGALVLYSFPLSVLMFTDVLRYEDSSQYESATVLGISRFKQFLSITLPYLKTPLISVSFAIFTMTFTDYGVPLMIGSKYQTLPVIMYNEVIGMLDFQKGSVIALILLLPSLFSFILNNKQSSDNLPINRKPLTIKSSTKVRVLSYMVCSSLAFFISLVMLSFIYVSFVVKYPQNLTFTTENFKRILGVGRTKYLFNSLFISFFTALCGTIIAFISSYLTTRYKVKGWRLIRFITISTIAIPGVVLGLSYALTFNKTALFGTLFILVVVNSIHFIASPYLMMSASLLKFNENLENVGSTLGVSRIRIVKDVILPLSFPTLIEMFTYFFVNTMVTVTAVSFLTSSSNMVLSLMINQFRAQLLLESAAAVSFVILFVNILLKVIFYVIKRYVLKKHY